MHQNQLQLWGWYVKPLIRQAEAERGAQEYAVLIVDDSVPKKGSYRSQ